jgi:hypothetical protein
MEANHEHSWQPMPFEEWLDWMADQVDEGATPEDRAWLRESLERQFADAPLDRFRCACGAIRTQNRLVLQLAREYQDARLEEGLLRLPGHMHDAVRDWVLRGEVHPRGMGHFMRAVFSNDFVEAACRADSENSRCLREWALFLYNDVPSACWGSLAKMERWYDAMHEKEPDHAPAR